MTTQFAVGDTVMVVGNTSCCNTPLQGYGKIFVIDHFEMVNGGVCSQCGTVHYGFLVAFDKKRYGCGVDALMKFPPVEILEKMQTEEQYFRDQP